MYKVINEIADKITGYCRVEIQTKEGKFDGFSFCSPNDDFSSFVGIRYAERRAVAAMCRYKAKLAKVQYNTIKKLKDDFLYNNIEIPRPVKIKLRDYSNDIFFWLNTASSLEESVYKEDKERLEILQKYLYKE